MRIEWDKYGNCVVLVAEAERDSIFLNGYWGSNGCDNDFSCRIDLPKEKLSGLIDRLITAWNEFYNKESK